MARIDVMMPQMGESIAEGTMSKWLKQVGDAVKRDEPIFEISTDKVDAEIPAPNAGVLAEVLVHEGETVAVGTIVARIETEAGAAVAAPASAPPAAPPSPQASGGASAPSTAPAAASPAPAAPVAPPVQAAPAKEAPPPAAKAAGAGTAEERLQQKSTPLVRKMVEEHGLDLKQIPGSGSAGRVTKNDVLAFIDGGGVATPASTPSSGGTAAVPSATPSRPAAPATGGAPTTVPPSATVEAWEGDKVEPWSRIRKLTADHMVLSRRVSAHVNSLMEIDYSHVASVRQKLKGEYASRGVNLTYLAFVVKAIAENLRKHPVVNAAVSGDNTIFRRDINIGIAVALDWGLIVPVIRHADELSLLGIARAIQDLAERARGKKLAPEDIQRGTFTITNPGGFGTYVGTPVINQPQVAILAVGAIEKRPSVVTLADGSDAIGIRTKGMWCLAYDHRVVDGADADRFLADVRHTLHNFPEPTG
jgi:pyruvate dehydrogenase E2 component (dihydrolipoamide acetyltransferase)